MPANLSVLLVARLLRACPAFLAEVARVPANVPAAPAPDQEVRV